MTEAEFMAKLNALPTNLQVEVADFIDFLVHKAASSNSASSTSIAEKAKPSTQVSLAASQEKGENC